MTQPKTRWAILAPTFGDARDTCIEGESGIQSTLNRYGAIQGYNRSQGQIRLRNGSIIQAFSAEEPERLRGPQHNGAWCFIPGTLIRTPNGLVPIESLNVGDLVETSTGVHPVLEVGSRIAELWQLTFDGGSLIGSGDHPVMTARGWVPLAGAWIDDILCLWTDDGNKISTGTSIATKPVKNYSGIESFGKNITGRYHQGITSIMSIMLRVTTGLKTLYASHLSSIEQFMPKSMSIRLSAQIAARHGKRIIPAHMPIVARNANTSVRMLNERINAETANTVARSLLREQGRSVVRDVSTLGRVGLVHNLTVAGSHDYYANNVLVHNCDELAVFRYAREAWDQLQFGLRLGQHPRTFISTTPKPTVLLRELLKRSDGSVVTSRGSTFDNAANLAPKALQEFLLRYEGTRLGRQELYGELIEDVEGALWSLALIESNRRELGNIVRRVVSVDPAVTNTANSDETGIIVISRDRDGHGYVEADRSMRGSPLEWASRVVQVFDEFECDSVVVEVNQGGDMVTQTLRTVRSHLPIREVRATKGKRLRAEPISAMYEQGRVHHVGVFRELEEQMTSWTPDDADSPDRLDALVHGFTELMQGGQTEAFLAGLAVFCACGFPNSRGAGVCVKCGAALAEVS